MTRVHETIPEALRPEVEAAVVWFNQSQDVPFEVTGILETEAPADASGPRDLHLILCGGDRCEQHSFRVASGANGFEVSATENGATPSVTDEDEARLDFESVGDPHHEIAAVCRKRG